MREITRGEFFLGLLVAILILFFRASPPLSLRDPDRNSSTYDHFNVYLKNAGVASTEHVQGIDEWAKQSSDEGAWNSPWRAKEHLPNFYAVLGVDPKVTDSDLEEVYARLLQKHAPGAVAGDINKESVEAIREAFGILHSHYHRCEYDHLQDIREGKWEALRAPCDYFKFLRRWNEKDKPRLVAMVQKTYPAEKAEEYLETVDKDFEEKRLKFLKSIQKRTKEERERRLRHGM